MLLCVNWIIIIIIPVTSFTLYACDSLYKSTYGLKFHQYSGFLYLTEFPLLKSLNNNLFPQVDTSKGTSWILQLFKKKNTVTTVEDEVRRRNGMG